MTTLMGALIPLIPLAVAVALAAATYPSASERKTAANAAPPAPTTASDGASR